MNCLRWQKTWRTCVLAFVVCLLWACPSLAEIAVYKVDRVVNERDPIQPGEPVEFVKPFAQVEIAAVDLADEVGDSDGTDGPWEFRKRADSMVMVGSQGVARDARVFAREMRCAYLCGDGGQSCRDTALIDWHSEPIGEPLLAVVGMAGEVTDFVSYLDAPSTEDIPQLNSDRTVLLSPPNTTLSMTTTENGLLLAVESYENPLELEPAECSWTAYGESGLGSLTCWWEAVLMYRERVLLLSYADYNVSQARVVNRFAVGERVYYTVALGQKGYTAYGLLFETNAGWQVVFSSKDWPTLC